MKFEVDIEIYAPESRVAVEEFESNNELILPSDYKQLLLNFNSLRLANDAMGMIVDDNGEEISGLDGALSSLKEFHYSSDPYPSIEYVNQEAAVKAAKDFFSIGTLFYQGVLLIGKLPGNENKIYGFVPEFQDAPFFLAHNIADFFNQRITIIE